MLIERDGVATPPPWPDVTWTLLNGFLTRGGCELRAAEFAARKSGIPCMGTKRRGDYHYQQQSRVPPQRTLMYPVRTNCQYMWCNQNRYRWNYRPTGIAQPQINIPAVVRPVPIIIPPLTMVTSTPYPRSFTFTTATTTFPMLTSEATTTTELPTPPPEVIEISSTTRFLRPERKQSNRTSNSSPLSLEIYLVLDTNLHRAEFFNPCPSGRPLMNEFETPITCNYLNQPNGGCPEDYWCHTGASFATTSCCPRTETVDKCEMRRDTGEGNELVARWYYDRNAKQCRRFLYKGIRGNLNNFVTKTQCMDACESSEFTQKEVRRLRRESGTTANRSTVVTQSSSIDLTNPCRFGEPAKHKNQTRMLCGPNDTFSCPSNYYCHLGETPETAVCCESSGLTDPCLLSLNVGQGKALLKRYYYNTFSKRCTEFVYRGTKGNENNFLTNKQCQDVCQKWSNPCPTSVNLASKKECSLNGTECSAGQWCHVGSSQATSVCCPGGVLAFRESVKGNFNNVKISKSANCIASASPDPCSLPMESGEGGMDLPRWYADPNDDTCTRQCKPFVYKGAKGNQNNFLTKTLCERKCKRHDNCVTRVKSASSGECKSPCGTGEMLMTPTKEPRLCSPTSPCPQSHWCHVGLTPETTVCCSAGKTCYSSALGTELMKAVPVANTCELPLMKGDGNSHLTRWHFDSTKRKCVKFIYSGEGGNQVRVDASASFFALL
ncbi:unnamed protein product [Heligmosomoides polygyrus]|uniref:Kunitz/Bovine pancreatic trypsin inhibitor domain protein n=1 Tax=Heligmosomoides polygyrus TaxID=6339 RepID=A0A3P8BYG9_HELPZ|nr:unnamed protein product [Heligmosomoides polygyrus]